MYDRTRPFATALTALTAFTTLVLLPLVTTAEVGYPAAAENDTRYVSPRTPWGDPDLQGVWDYRSITPLERPHELGDREFYSDEEVAQLEAQAARRMDEPPGDDAPANLVHAQYMTDPGRRIDESRRTSLIVDPPDGRLPPLTQAAQARRAQAATAAPLADGADSANTEAAMDAWLQARAPLERCISWGLPQALLPGLYNNNILIAQSPGYVTIVHEMVHEARVVPLDGRPFGELKSWMGESRGYWEGETLVVQTRNFNGRSSYRGAGGNMHLTERYTRVADEGIEFRLTVEDDSHWTRPWTAAFSMRPTEGGMYEYACHEGNYALRFMMEVARDELAVRDRQDEQ